MLWDDFNTTWDDQPLAGNKQLFSRGVSKAHLGETAAKARFVPHCDGVDAPPNGIVMCHAGAVLADQKQRRRQWKWLQSSE